MDPRRRTGYGDGASLEIAQAGHAGDPASIVPGWAQLFVLPEGQTAEPSVAGRSENGMVGGIICPAAAGAPEIHIPMAPEMARQLISTLRLESGTAERVQSHVRHKCMSAGWRPRPTTER
jgi:hypothetical protein